VAALDTRHQSISSLVTAFRSEFALIFFRKQKVPFAAFRVFLYWNRRTTHSLSISSSHKTISYQAAAAAGPEVCREWLHDLISSFAPLRNKSWRRHWSRKFPGVCLSVCLSTKRKKLPMGSSWKFYHGGIYGQGKWINFWKSSTASGSGSSNFFNDSWAFCFDAV